MVAMRRKPTDPGHVHAVKRTVHFNSASYEICNCGTTRRVGEEWRFTSAYTPGLKRPDTASTDGRGNGSV
jgi:hypothetical protein